MASKPKSRFPKKLTVEEMRERQRYEKWVSFKSDDRKWSYGDRGKRTVIFYGLVGQGPFNKPHRTELAIYKKRRGAWRKVYDRETSVLHRFTNWIHEQFVD